MRRRSQKAATRAQRLRGSIGSRRNSSSTDFYPTPASATEALFHREVFSGNVWECACGDGSMSRVIERFNGCLSSDIMASNNTYGAKGIDFLRSQHRVDNIISNPPFKYATEFVDHAKKSARRKIAFLLPLRFLEGRSRKTMFEDTEFPLKAVYVFSNRLSFQAHGHRNAGGMMAFAWFVWDRAHKGPARVHWFDTAEQIFKKIAGSQAG